MTAKFEAIKNYISTITSEAGRSGFTAKEIVKIYNFYNGKFTRYSINSYSNSNYRVMPISNFFSLTDGETFIGFCFNGRGTISFSVDDGHKTIMSFIHETR